MVIYYIFESQAGVNVQTCKASPQFFGESSMKCKKNNKINKKQWSRKWKKLNIVGIREGGLGFDVFDFNVSKDYNNKK